MKELGQRRLDKLRQDHWKQINALTDAHQKQIKYLKAPHKMKSQPQVMSTQKALVKQYKNQKQQIKKNS